jgi:putative RecB family exonuclease
LSTFEQCPQKFKFRYIDKIIPEIEKTIEAHLGSSVHLTLEWLYTKAKEAENKKQIPSLDDTIVFYSEAWRRDFSPDIVIIDTKSTVKDYYNKGIQFLVDYYTKHFPFKDGTIDIEKKIILKLDSDGEYEIIGFIDRLAQNLHTGEFEIHDYKTGNSMPSQEDIDNDRQLALYAMAIKEIYGKDKSVSLNWHYLAHNKKISSRRTNEQLEKLKQETLELIKKIEATEEFPPVKSPLCKWCEYIQMCPIWNTSEENLPKKESEIINNKKYPTISKYIKD